MWQNAANCGFLRFVLLLGWFCALPACKPSYDSILKDVERNYVATGFLDPDTFQIRCALEEQGDRLTQCRARLTAELVAYKERYDREAYARRMHQDFLPFLAHAPVSEEKRAGWAHFYDELARDRSRLVYERRSGERMEGIFRLRLEDLIYRVQKAP
ncbi:MAG: hypothetical protein U1F27_13290 [Turneriella sp.]